MECIKASMPDSLLSLVEVQIAQVFRRVHGQCHFLIIEYHPLSILEDVTDVMSNQAGRSHVTDEAHQPVLCGENTTA